MGELVELPQYRNKKVSDNDNSGGGGRMDNYVTHKELDDMKSQIDTSLKLTEKNIQLMFHEERDYHRKNKSESVKWIVGTGIAVIGTLLTITGLIFTYLRFFTN
ncbi:hypothetical protein P9H08_10065 [Bacillus cereus]|uniref:hypothetical protein n=1 Tax=Bacillus thuringiensis TaxID=1428 RepID=UPI000BFD0884|nr:hypothetical protein [Bacillus thuringiensis]MEC2257021.1 hypothetical protein [Bacillus cereus]PGK73619.1 hypothetical protein CN919_26730 [Bacillus thuringiensis]